MIDIIVYLAIIVILILVVWFLLSQLDLPEPARKIVTIVVVVLVAAVAIGLLLNIGGHAPSIRLR